MDIKSHYNNSGVRRQDRVMEYEQALEIIIKGEYGFLAIGGEEGYGIPLNYVLEGNSIYFHCAPEGEKLKRMQANDRVCFCIVGLTKPEPSRFSTQYESVLIFGRITLVEEVAERVKALEYIVGKYAPEFKEMGRKYAEKSFERTAILRLDIEKVSGKTKKIM